MSRPLRLLSIAHSYAVALNRRLAHELSRAGGEKWEITAIAPNYFHGSRDLRPITFQKIADEPIRVEVVPARMTRSVHLFTYSWRLNSILKSGWDFVHSWEEPYVAAGAQIAWATPKNVPLAFWTAQNLFKSYPPPFAQFEKFVVRRCAGWMACGQSTLDAMVQKPGYTQKPHEVFPLGVDTERFRPGEGEKLWEESGPPTVGFLGRFTEEKGLRLAMNVLDQLDTRWRALFVGAGPMESELNQWSRKHADRVRVCTNVAHDQVPRYLNAMDVLIAPSQTTPHWREQFGRMLIEAFACGVPVVGSDSGEIPHVIGDAGIVVGETDERAWRNVLHELLESPARRKELSDRGLERAQQYAWPAIARRCIEFFTQILDARAGRC